MKKWLLGLTSALLLAGCGAATTTSSGGAQEDSDVIKLGANFELTGKGASYGTAMYEAMQLAVEQVNADGGVNGKQIEIVNYDNKSDETETASVATKLATVDNVSGIVGPALSGDAKAQAPIAEEHGIPAVLPAATDDSVTLDAAGEVLKQIFRVCFQDSFQGVALANYSTDKEYKTAVVIKDNSTDYGQKLAENFRKTFEENGGTIVAEESYVAGDTDFQAILTNIKSKDFDVIFIPGYYTEAGTIIKQARQAGITQPILGPDGFGESTLIELAGAENVTDVFYSAHFSMLTEDAKAKEFLAAYKEKYNKDASMFSALGYDATMVLIDAIKRAESADPALVTEQLAATKDYPGITGTFTIDEKHNPVKDAYVIELQNGEEAGVEVIEAAAK